MTKIVMGIQLDQRNELAQDVQGLLTKYGCCIKTRLGIHPTLQDACSQRGLILVEFLNDTDTEAEKLEQELTKLPNVVVKKMIF